MELTHINLILLLLLPFTCLASEFHDGFMIDESLMDEMDHQLQSHEQHKEEDPTKHTHFEKVCSPGFFTCANGECIAHKWRCDGHYDCDDFSDELNCTSISDILPTGDAKHMDSAMPPSPQIMHSPQVTSVLRNTTIPKIDGIEFNSSIEPLMIFSTGLSIRGFWMKSRIYFDIVSIGSPTVKSHTPSITEAFSLFFGAMLGPDFIARPRTSEPPEVSPSASAATRKTKTTIVGVDMDPNNKEVYWVELGKDAAVYSAKIKNEEFESRQRREFQSHKKIVEFGLVSPEDIALDTVGKNAYITDAGLPAIVVCSLEHSHCKVIVEDNIHKPRAITADSTIGWIYYTDWGDRPGIFLVSMDGYKRETLIDTDVVWPNGLAADYESNQLYWADARLNKIERVDLRTRKRVEIFKESSSNPFSVSIFENRIYWSDWSGNNIKSIDKTWGNNSKTVLNADDIYGIHIYHPDLHRNEPSNPCWSMHCSHLCLLTPTSPSFKSSISKSARTAPTASCACPNSMALSLGDKSSCYEIHMSFLLINVHNYIGQVYPDRIGLHVAEEIVYSPDHAIQDIASDWVHSRMFFFDAMNKLIFLVDLNEGAPQIHALTSSGTSVRGLLYDKWTDSLFWLDHEAGTLEMLALKSNFQKTILRGLDHPTSLVLDGRNRVFYLSTLGSASRIMRVDISGSDKFDLRSMSIDVGLPVALFLDEKQQRLYFADAKHETIESVDLDIKSRSDGIVHLSQRVHRKNLGTILALAIHRDSFIWSIQDDDYLYKSNIGSRYDLRPVTYRLPPNQIQHPTSDHRRILSIDPIQLVYDTTLCSRRACSHACMLDMHHEAHCICPMNNKLQASNSSNCVDINTTEPPPLPIALKIPLPVSARPPPAPRVVATDAPPHSPFIVTSNESSVHVHEIGSFKEHTFEVPSSASLMGAEADGGHSGKVEGSSSLQQSSDVSAAKGDSGMVWLIVLIIMLSVAGLVVLLIMLSRLPRSAAHLSQLSVSFKGNSNAADKDQLMLDQD